MASSGGLSKEVESRMNCNACGFVKEVLIAWWKPSDLNDGDDVKSAKDVDSSNVFNVHEPDEVKLPQHGGAIGRR